MNRHSSHLKKLKSVFPKLEWNLTERQWVLLSYIALTDSCEYGTRTLKSELKLWYPTNEELRADLEVLVKKHYVKEIPTWGDRTYEVDCFYYMKVALNALLYYPELPRYDRSDLTSRDALVQCIFNNDTEKLGRMFDFQFWLMSECAKDLIPVMFDEAFSAIFEKAPQEELASFFSFALLSNEANGTIDKSFLDRAEKFIKDYVEGDERKLMSEVNAYRWFAEGIWTDSLVADSSREPVAASTCAVKLLYKGDYKVAIDLFERALKLEKNRDARLKSKNYLPSPVMTYFLISAYILEGSEKYQKKLASFLNKKADPLQFGAAIYLAQKSLGYDDMRIMDGIPSVGCMFRETLELYAGFESHFGASLIKEKVEVPAPLMAIVRYETGIGLGEEERQSLENLFGGSPIMSRMHFKQPWEHDLAILENLIEGSCDQKVEDKKSGRLIYVANKQGQVTIKEQGILKSGRWSAGKAVAISSLLTGFYGNVCDEYDSRVIERLRSRLILNDAHLFPALIGCDRVFYDSYDEENRIAVNDETPFITLERDKKQKMFVFGTNVPKMRYYNEFMRESVIKINPHTYNVIRLNLVQKQFLDKLFSTKATFPENAESTLQGMVPRIEKIIEVHSEYFRSASIVEDKDGNPMIYIRIIPKPASFALTLYTRPLAGGKITFRPGLGEHSFYDASDGKRWHVNRDMKTERANFKTLSGRIDFESMDFDEEYYLPSIPQMLDILEQTRDMTDICTLEWPEGKQLKVLGRLEQSAINIHVKSNENWFEIEGEANAGEHQFTLDQIMAALSAGGYSDGYLKMGEDEYVALSDSLAKYMKRLESLGQSQKGKERVSVFQAGPLADLVKKSGVNAAVDNEYKKAVERMKSAEKYVPTVPDGLKADLRDYQLDGYKWMSRLDYWGAGACLADDMGLGKTVQTIAFLLSKAAEGPSLVVAPASVVMNWQRELAKFAPTLHPVIFNEAYDRSATLSSAVPYDVVITTYGLLTKEQETFSGISWNVACLDEAHTIKNRDTKMSAAAMSLHAGSRIILTGTPVQNYLGELWNLYQFINPGLLGTFEQFSAKFITPIENGDEERRAQLKRIIQPFILRRTKGEVVEELPDKTEITRLVELSPAEFVAYETMRKDAKSKLESEGKVNVNALAAITKLREAACAMPLVRKGWKETPTKISALMELVQEIISGGNSVLIFSQFTSFLNMVSNDLKASGIEHFYLNGSTPIKQRQVMVNDFQHGSCPVFLISLKAGGLGLNLTGANYVIHLDPWWNPAIEQQATDRAYRIGQQQNVTVYHLISKGTIEEKILRLHKVKQNLADSILEGTSQSHAITLAELRELVNS